LVCTVYFTASNEKEALRIGELLVKERLAACINVFPIKSIFWWKGKVERSEEIGVFVKTQEKLFKKIVKRIRELHSYDLPVIEKINVKSYKAVEKWVKTATR